VLNENVVILSGGVVREANDAVAEAPRRC